eukprot:TRINITY_DN16533_c0_g1_i1.p2 TRINITY_DN16533_c0_g1~~TRINITY_DN16533_c0_g1_i1.p2  ORF type:complete len:201 (+),score=43.01 TRINITY_DN16533_c0_g1_i1:143-745(+)
MIIPMPAVPMQMGTPTTFALKQRPLMLGILVVQSFVCVVRIVAMLDIIGGFIMAMMIGIGWYAWYETMNIMYISCWGMLCFINGVFDLVRYIDFAVKNSNIAFTGTAGLLLLAIPVSCFLGAAQAWFLYKDNQEAMAGADPFMQHGQYGQYGNAPYYGAAPGHAAPGAGAGPAGAWFGGGRLAGAQPAFTGQGQRLGDGA